MSETEEWNWAADREVAVGAMLYTLVDPHRGYESAFSRWYERDHFYGGCMIGPWILAGTRWVSTRRLKDLRFPSDSAVAQPVDAGSYLATYWIHAGHEAEHLAWATPQVHALYANDRGFEHRTHAHTALYTHQRDWYRDPDPVPITLALDHRYAGLVSVHVDRVEGVKHPAFDDWFEAEGRTHMLGEGSSFASGVSWRPIIPRLPEGQQAPMPLGSGPGTPTRSMQLFFCETDPSEIWDQVHTYAEAINNSGLATVSLAAPFIPAIIGTDTYSDELW